MGGSPSIAPFPYMGGKRKVAADVWTRFGDVRNYVEPFAGSLAVLLARPGEGPWLKAETVNDADHFLANFWRAVKSDPVEVARWADWPVNETDLRARHLWLVTEGGERIAMCETDATHYDAQVAGWWVWGICAWLGSGWCSQPSRKIPHLADGGQGIHRQIPHLVTGGRGIHRQIPHLVTGGRGIHRQIPHLGTGGRGIHRQIPHLGTGGQGIQGWFEWLAARLRRVRVACGDWTRVVSKAVTFGDPCGVFLDPPYKGGERYYATGEGVAAAVRDWAIEAGKQSRYRIALCGLEGEHAMPDGWEQLAWKHGDGYAPAAGRPGRDEVIWFSPGCLRPDITVISAAMADMGGHVRMGNSTRA